VNETKEIREIRVLGHGPTALQRRRARKEARGLAASARRSLARHRHRVGQEASADLQAAIGAAETAVEKNDHDAICETLVKLDALAEQHLSFTRKSTFREYADSIGVAVLVALLLRAFVVEAFKIPSGSMIPTMEVGDHIFVNKFIYGLRIPFTRVKFFEWRKPRRGEVIVFIYPNDPGKDFIKRIVGVEGDTLEVRRNVLHVNGAPVDHRVVPGPYTYWDYDEQRDSWHENLGKRVEEIVGGRPYVTLHDPDEHEMACRYACYEPYVVPPGHVFVLGDNRNNSHDSRFWGPVPLENIKGKALVIWWSSGGPEGVRWGRLGRLVD
jgi:signal peptidase I